MIHKSRRRKLGRSSTARKALLVNLTRSLILHEQIKTTLPKAKEVKPFAEKIITLAKIDSVNNRRKVTPLFKTKPLVQKFFSDLGPRIKDRKGGYLRIMRCGFRNGDKAEMAIIELVDRKNPSVTKENKVASINKSIETNAEAANSNKANNKDS
jgi:large subunit ribosomal protein L17